MPSNTTPKVISDKARALYERVTEAERYHSAQATIYEALKANRHSDALKMQQADQRERAAWRDLVEARSQRDAWLDGRDVAFPDSQITSGAATPILRNIKAVRQGEYDRVVAVSTLMEAEANA